MTLLFTLPLGFFGEFVLISFNVDSLVDYKYLLPLGFFITDR